MGEQGITGHQGAGAETVTIGRGSGAKDYNVVEQGIGRLERRIRPIVAVFSEADSSEEAAELDIGVVRDALVAFIPNLAPEYQLRGLRDEAALAKLNDEGVDALTEDEVTDTDPSIPQLMNAIEVIYRVNGGDRLTRFLGKFVDPEMLRARIRYELRTRGVQPTVEGTGRPAGSDTSPTSRHTNGGSAQTPSGTTPQTDPATISD
jgi:hypothetical protein